MPGMTGLEMLPKMKEMRLGVPIIMITAYGDSETKRSHDSDPRRQKPAFAIATNVSTPFLHGEAKTAATALI